MCTYIHTQLSSDVGTVKCPSVMSDGRHTSSPLMPGGLLPWSVCLMNSQERPASTSEADADHWVNLLVLHQNRVQHGAFAKNCIQVSEALRGCGWSLHTGTLPNSAHTHTTGTLPYVLPAQSATSRTVICVIYVLSSGVRSLCRGTRLPTMCSQHSAVSTLDRAAKKAVSNCDTRRMSVCLCVRRLSETAGVR